MSSDQDHHQSAEPKDQGNASWGWLKAIVWVGESLVWLVAAVIELAAWLVFSILFSWS